MDLKIIPRISEKSLGMAESGVYTFNAPTTANKQRIADAVAKQFDVHVVSIKTVVAKGKTVRSYRKGKPVTGKRNDFKKAYVTLAEGEKIAAFEQEAK